MTTQPLTRLHACVRITHFVPFLHRRSLMYCCFSSLYLLMRDCIPSSRPKQSTCDCLVLRPMRVTIENSPNSSTDLMALYRSSLYALLSSLYDAEISRRASSNAKPYPSAPPPCSHRTCNICTMKFTTTQLSALPCRYPQPLGTAPVVPIAVTTYMSRSRSDSPTHCAYPVSLSPCACMDINMRSVLHAS